MKKPTPDTTKPRKYLTRMMVCPDKCMSDNQKKHPQCAVYSNGEYYCFGCGARGKVDGGKT